MLRKIELKLNYLVEAREYIALGEKKDELETKEKQRHTIRKEENIKKKRQKEYMIQEERQRKNMERIRK